jgi:hypothetical protein
MEKFTFKITAFILLTMLFCSTNSVFAQSIFKKNPYNNQLEIGARGTDLRFNKNSYRDMGDYNFDPKRNKVMASSFYGQYTYIYDRHFKLSAGFSIPLFFVRHSIITNNSPHVFDVKRTRSMIGFDENFNTETNKYELRYNNPIYVKGVYQVFYKNWIFGAGMELGLYYARVRNVIENVTKSYWYNESDQLVTAGRITSTELDRQIVYKRIAPYFRPILNVEHGNFVYEFQPMPHNFTFSMGYKFN